MAIADEIAELTKKGYLWMEPAEIKELNDVANERKTLAYDAMTAICNRVIGD